ncbi:MAG: hypothetical protein ACREO1_06515 [Arenimonas sp.]
MKSYRVLLLLAVWASQSFALEVKQEPKDVLLLVDKSISTLNGAAYPMPIESAFAIETEDAGKSQLYLSVEHMNGTAGSVKSNGSYSSYVSMPYISGANSGAAMGGGLIAIGVIETKIMMDRQKPIQPLRELLNSGALRNRFLSSAKQAVSMHGFNVRQTIIMPDVDDDKLKTVMKNSDLKDMIMVRKISRQPISISSNNTTPIFSLNIAITSGKISATGSNTTSTLFLSAILERTPATS